MSQPLHNAAGNAALLAIGTAVESALQFVFILIASRELGPEEFGFFSYLVSIYTFVQVVIQFGLQVVVVRELVGQSSAEVFGKEPVSTDFRWQVVLRAMFRIRIWLALVGFLVVIAAVLLDPGALDRRLAVMIMFSTVLAIPLDVQAVFDARKASRWDVPGRLLGRLMSVIVLILLWLIDNELTLFETAVCSTVNIVIIGVVGWWLAYRLRLMPTLSSGADPGARRRLDNAIQAETKRLVRLASPITWATLMATVYLFSQTILVKWLSTELETGYYALASRLVLPILMVKGIIYRLILPLLAEVNREPERFNARLERLIPLLALIFMPAVAIAVPLAALVMQPVFGQEYDGAVLPAQISLSHIFLTGIGSICGTALFALGFQRTYTWSVTTGCAVCLALGALWIPQYGAIGAAWATVAAEIAAVLVTIKPFLKHAQPSVAVRLVKIALSSLLLPTAFYGVTLGFGTNPWVSLAIGAALCSVALWRSGEMSRERINIILGIMRRRQDAESPA